MHHIYSFHALIAVTHRWSLQLLLIVCTWEGEHEEVNFRCTKCEHLTCKHTQ